MKSIDTLLDELVDLLETLTADSSVLGYFPALYRRVTLKVKATILAGRFEDADR